MGVEQVDKIGDDDLGHLHCIIEVVLRKARNVKVE
jgi:hypothetical protein